MPGSLTAHDPLQLLSGPRAGRPADARRAPGHRRQAPPDARHLRLHGSHYSFVDPEEARFLTAELLKATCLTRAPEEIVEQVRGLEQQGLRRIMLYPPLNRQHRVIENFADHVMSRL